MTLTPWQTAAIFAVIALGTALTRFLPFWLFPENKPLPRVVSYLGRVLPPAMIALLVVYCFKDVRFSEGSCGLPELICCAVVAALQHWGKNTLLSIALGTVLYMALVQLVFV